MRYRVKVESCGVLVVDDEPPIRDLLSELLEHAGYHVRQAADGPEALDHLQEAPPDLIVLDLVLPRMSGWEFLELVRARPTEPEIPVLILSAESPTAQDATAFGIGAWLTKPIENDRFLNAVSDLVRSRYAPAPRSTAEARKRILLVEDERGIRGVVARWLEEDGYSVTTASDLIQATDHLQHELPDLIVLDVMLPGRSGLELLRERREDAKLASIPVVVTSAVPQNRRTLTQELGADAYISKPFDLEVLSALLKRFVALP